MVDLGKDEDAIPLLEEAMALDSGFAMGYRKLAVAIGNSQGLASREAAVIEGLRQLIEVFRARVRGPHRRRSEPRP